MAQEKDHLQSWFWTQGEDPSCFASHVERWQRRSNDYRYTKLLWLPGLWNQPRWIILPVAIGLDGSSREENKTLHWLGYWPMQGRHLFRSWSLQSREQDGNGLRILLFIIVSSKRCVLAKWRATLSSSPAVYSNGDFDGRKESSQFLSAWLHMGNNKKCAATIERKRFSIFNSIFVLSFCVKGVKPLRDCWKISLSRLTFLSVGYRDESNRLTQTIRTRWFWSHILILLAKYYNCFLISVGKIISTTSDNFESRHSFSF